MDIWHISDTHGHHHQLTPPKVDMVLFTGDGSNYRDQFRNEPEMRDFLNWFAALPIKYKVMIAGNHDSAVYHKLIKSKEIEARGIIYLEDSGVEIEGVKIWGSPWSPTYGGWWYMKDRSKLNKNWMMIPEDVDILMTHTPPKGILDVSHKRDGSLELCGCSALMKRVRWIMPKYHLFGHIHDGNGIINAGTRQLSGIRTVFSNGSVVTDNKFGHITSTGQVFTI